MDDGTWRDLPTTTRVLQEGEISAGELRQWVDKYGLPEDWAKRAQAAHARAERAENERDGWRHTYEECQKAETRARDERDAYRAALRLVKTMADEYRKAEAPPGYFAIIETTVEKALEHR